MWLTIRYFISGLFKDYGVIAVCSFWLCFISHFSVKWATATFPLLGKVADNIFVYVAFLGIAFAFWYAVFTCAYLVVEESKPRWKSASLRARRVMQSKEERK